MTAETAMTAEPAMTAVGTGIPQAEFPEETIPAFEGTPYPKMPPSKPPVVEGDATVTTNSYGLPEGTGYNSSVAFMVSNPNKDLAIQDLQYRVTLKSGDRTLVTSDGEDRVDIPPGLTRLVVFTSNEVPVNKKPNTATVRVYPTQDIYVMPEMVPEQSQWKVSNEEVQCTEGLVQCELIGDITWTGKDPQSGLVVDALVRAGSGASGPILAAGSGGASTEQVAQGDTVPFTVTLIGFEQPKDEGGAVPPKGPTKVEVYVESSVASP